MKDKGPSMNHVTFRGGSNSEFFEHHDVFHEKFIRQMHTSLCFLGGGRKSFQRDVIYGQSLLTKIHVV